MEHKFELFAHAVALTLECMSVLLIAWGALRAAVAVVGMNKDEIRGDTPPPRGRSVFLTLGRYLLLGLEFTLAADVVRTAIAPSWNDIGKLAAIAVIRTFLNYFLERDIEHARAQTEPLTATRSA
jgi:uncharacterized membrane protein